MSIKISYLAYRQASKNVEESLLPQLPYSNNQLFWINSAQNLCTDDLPNEPKIIDDKYTAFEFYYVKLLTSVREFYDDFNCSSDKSFIKLYGKSCSYL